MAESLEALNHTRRPERLYEKCGFAKEAQQEDIILMRKVL